MLLKIKHIASKEDLLAWARFINGGCYSLHDKCDLQDIYARSQRDDLDKFFIECEGDRKLVICSVNNVMAFDEVEHLLSVLAKSKTLAQWELDNIEWEKREAEVVRKERILDDAVRNNDAVVQNLVNANAQLKEEVAHLNESLRERGEEMYHLRQRQAEDTQKARKYDALKDLLA
jgi:uncharacterized protein YoxC